MRPKKLINSEKDLLLPAVDFLAIFFILGVAGLVALVLPAAAGMVVGAAALLACGLYPLASSNDEEQKIDR